MGIVVSNMSLNLAVAESLREIQHELFQGPVPQFLHHYTKFSAVVKSIVQNRSLWATCIADESDQTEISHASEMVAHLAKNLQCPEISEFSLSVLKRLPFFMEERKRWIFIACFCDDQDSDLHWREYGDYCLTFPSPWVGMPSLALSDPRPNVGTNESFMTNGNKKTLWSVRSGQSRSQFPTTQADETKDRGRRPWWTVAHGTQRSCYWDWPWVSNVAHFGAKENGGSFALHVSELTALRPNGLMTISRSTLKASLGVTCCCRFT